MTTTFTNTTASTATALDNRLLSIAKLQALLNADANLKTKVEYNARTMFARQTNELTEEEYNIAYAKALNSLTRESALIGATGIPAIGFGITALAGLIIASATM